MKKLLVTASSKTKLKTNEIAFKKSEKPFYASLSDKNKKIFFNARSYLLDEFGLDEGPDTNDSLAKTEEPIYLPAYLRYKGRTFSKVTPEAWDALNSNTDAFDCVILSAFYGIIRFNEPIRNYSIRQDTKMKSGQTISKYWRDQGASEWLFDYIKKNNIEEVKFVLSTEYSGIVKRDELMRQLKDELGISSEERQFKEAGGMKAMTSRGQYINDFLLEKFT